MKKLLVLLLVLGAGAFFFMKEHNTPGPKVLSDRDGKANSQNITPKSVKAQESVFVPYWTLQSKSSLSQYSEAYYFAVVANEEGIDRDEIGYARIQSFLDKTEGVDKQMLVVSMVDKDVNSEILKDPEVQLLIAQESVQIAKEYGFDGVVLDFEIASISFDAVTNRVSTFYTTFADQVKKTDLAFYTTLYGDTYYRVRAYDVKKIGELSDKVLIMSYDFHKSRGNPGPNFPLGGKEKYGYDFAQMITDFTNDVNPEKLEVIFGMFGYDWEVDDEGKATSYGEALTTQEVTDTFIDDCQHVECKWERDSMAQEIWIQYTNGEGNNHVIWLEDKESVARKKAYIQNLGISKISYWTYSYFE